MSSTIEQAINTSVRYLSKPAWKATEFFLINDLSWRGTASKVFGVVATIFAAPLAIIGQTLYFFSQQYYQSSYLSYESRAPHREGPPKKFLSLNVCMFPGGLPTPFGGVTPASMRMNTIADFLKGQDADIICLQEMGFDPATQMIDQLKHHYRYFYYRIGPNPFRMESAIFWASKYKPIKEPQFIPYQVPGMQWGIKRGFFIVELENYYIVTTHLDPFDEKGGVRAQQVECISNHMKNLTGKPFFLLGDFNTGPQDQKTCELLKQQFAHFKDEEVLNPTEENSTCCNNLTQVVQDAVEKPHRQEIPQWRRFDHILAPNSIQDVFQNIIQMFNIHEPLKARSDHYAVTLEFFESSRQISD